MSVRVGIVGAGLWGGNHAMALKDHPGCTLAVICDQVAGRAQTIADKCGCAWTTNVDEVAASDVDAVTVATPDHLHAAPVLALLGAGKHVLVEKPLATTVAEAQAMVDAAERAGRSLMVDFHARWHPLYMGAKGYVERGVATERNERRRGLGTERVELFRCERRDQPLVHVGDGVEQGGVDPQQ